MTVLAHVSKLDLQGRPGNTDFITVVYEFLIPSVTATSTSDLYSLFVGTNIFLEELSIYSSSTDYDITLRNRAVDGDDAFYYNVHEMIGINKYTDSNINKIFNNVEREPYVYIQVKNDAAVETGPIRLVLSICQM